MIILKQTYQTSLSKEQIEHWLELRKNEHLAFFIKKYIVELKENTFKIRRLRTGRHQPMFAQVIGKYNYQGDKVFIKVQQSIFGTIFFLLFFLAVPFVVILKDETITNGQVTTLFSNESLIIILILYLFLIVFAYIFLIRTVYKTRTWIESELKLINRTKE